MRNRSESNFQDVLSNVLPISLSRALMRNNLKGCQKGSQDITSTRAPYPYEFEEIKLWFNPHLVKDIHIQMQKKKGSKRMWELPLGSCCQLCLGFTLPGNKWLAPGQFLFISQLAHPKFPIPFIDSIILSCVPRTIYRASFFLMDSGYRRLS